MQMTDSPTTVFTTASTETTLYPSTSPPKRKRRPAGTPDPDAEVIALSPRTLMESDRYVCEICNQGFQRDQNLQMHRRRHKVPWKLLKRVDPEVRKRVYVCPEPSCLHHNPCHALGDLVGIKKHYRRKHSSMRQWECDKCDKAYAVQSDYKAHVKTCGTRGHCCDCGRVFSRVESFIEHQDTCTAARSKKGNASYSGPEAASFTSLAVPTAPYHATVMTTNTSNSAEKSMKDSYHHNAPILSSPLNSNVQDCSDISLCTLPSPSLASPHALAMSSHACISIPAVAPPDQVSPASSSFLVVNAGTLPRHSPLSMTNMHSQAKNDGRISWETHQPCIPPSHVTFQHHKTELQLLPTSKPHLSQLESSQSSVTWGKDITSTNSTTSGTCSSPASKTVNGKCAHRGADVSEMLLMSGCTASTARDTPCTLQLSIGLSNNDDFAYTGTSTSLRASTDFANEEDKSETLDSKATKVPWLGWGASAPEQRTNDSCDNVPNVGVAKRHASSHSSHGKQGMTCHMDAYKDALSLELAAGFRELKRAGDANLHNLDAPHQSSLAGDKVSHSEAVGSDRAHGFTDKFDSKSRHSVQQAEEVMELLQLAQRSSKLSLDSKGVEEAQTQTSGNLLLGSIEEPDYAAELLQPAETSNFSLGPISVVQKPNFSAGPDMNSPAAAARTATALLQKAREKLKKASADELEAETAWRAAKREREQAEEELAIAQTIAKYKRMIAVGKAGLVQQAENLQKEEGATRKTICRSSTSSLPNSPSSSSPLHVMQLHAGRVLCSAPSFITCPTCHHTIQILYPSPNSVGTLFLASPLEIAPASTPNTTPQIKLSSSPTL